MGSFFSTCSVSGMTLNDNMPVVRFLLLPQSKSKGYDTRDILKSKGLIVSNEGATAAFVPFGFPIRGRYYDYGQIDEIVHDDGVKMLEAFFGLDIDSILDIASDGREEPDGEDAEEGGKVKHLKLLKMLTYTDIHAEVYDHLARVPESIEPAAAPESEDDYEDDYYLRQWNSWRNGYFETCDLYESGKLDEKGEPTEALHAEDGGGFANMPLGMESEDAEKRKASLKAMLRLDMQIRGHTTHERGFIRAYGKLNMFIALHPWMRRSHEPIIVGMRNFISSLTEMRKIILPSMYGSQDTNWRALLDLNAKTTEIMTALQAAEDEEYRKYAEEDE